jgi:hypothetical protein
MQQLRLELTDNCVIFDRTRMTQNGQKRPVKTCRRTGSLMLEADMYTGVMNVS